MDIGTAILIVAGAIITIVGAIMAIWGLTEKSKGKLETKISTLIKSALLENNLIQERETKLLLDSISAEQMLRIEMIREDMIGYVNNLEETNTKIQDCLDKQKAAIIEAFKQDIRAVYFKLRATGELDDIDKSYVDKIYHYYSILGGNSDIHAKMEEMNKVYSKKTFEAVEKKSKKKE